MWRVALAAALIWTGAAHAGPSRAAMSAMESEMVRNHVLGRFPARCVVYHLQDETKQYVEARAYEDHTTPGCPGDKGTAPTILMVRYMKATGVVLMLNDEGDAWKPFAR